MTRPEGKSRQVLFNLPKITIQSGRGHGLTDIFESGYKMQCIIIGGSGCVFSFLAQGLKKTRFKHGAGFGAIQRNDVNFDRDENNRK